MLNFGWSAGIRLFRLARRLHLSTKLEFLFAGLARFVPASSEVVVATLADGSQLSMPPGYRDTRTVLTGLFQADETDLLLQLIRPGMTFVDVGAYVGYFTILMSGQVAAAGRVYAFEPDELAYRYLLSNIELNQRSNIVAVNNAISDRAKTVTMVRDPRGPESFVVDVPAEGHASATEAVTLDAFFARREWPAVDVMKMNIEGSELAAIRGMQELSQRNPQLQLVMEHNPGAMDRAGVTRGELSATLAAIGFRQGLIVERRLEPVPPGSLLPSSRAVYNILLKK